MSKLRITPLGTCRIHTPLKRAAARYPIEVDLRRNYGFVHSSAEALQLLQFLKGEKTFRPEVSPLIFRDGDLEKYAAEQWEPSDLHLVEISSVKLIRSGSDAVQGNYIQRYFSDFFANTARSRDFWALARKGNRRDLVLFLREQSTYNLLSKSDRELLASLSMEQQSFKAIKSDMAEIVETLGKDKVLFVTHVNATTPDGELIPVRDRLVRWMKLAAEQLGASIFDPTPAMEEFGQEQALEDGGLDLTHYTLPFSDRLFDLLYQSHIGALAQSLGAVTVDDEERRLGMLATRIEAQLEFGDFFTAAKEVHSALDDFPNAQPLIELRGLIRSRIGDYEGAVADLGRRDSALLSQSMRIALVEALSRRGQYNRAVEVAEDLIGDEVESAQIYRFAAVAAEKGGRGELAIRYAKQASRLDRSNLPTGLHALRLLIDHGDPAEAAEWRLELLDNIGTASSSGAFELATWALKHGDEQLFSAAFAAGAARDKVGSIDLLEDAFTAGMMRGLASGLPLAVSLGRLAPALAERRQALIEQSLEKVEGLIDAGRTAEAYELARAIIRLSDISNSQLTRKQNGFRNAARRLVLRISQQVRKDMRAAFGEDDMAEVVRIGEAAGEVAVGDPDTATILARALAALDRTDEAVKVLRATLAENPDNVGARRWLGRYSASLEDYAAALNAYGSLRREDSVEVEPIRPEIERFFAIVERRALKALRELTDSGRDDEALELADAITTHLGPLERTSRELARLHRNLRLQLRAMDQGEGELEEREGIYRRLLRIRPGDQSALRGLALELMRQFRFAEAAAAWEQLHEVDPDNESADRNRVRCATLANRRASAGGAETIDVG